ncbi:carboxypeptidase-like regulatory domain-containing protein [Asinibacterium sp. OR53]|uniref:carboxypeptidase-like regulatory domain-containing protein n=1 Tax=Asinibacterium sp. OR53 TaxID=925409 RepID=UPI000478E3A2|nr:carboxypeptidase-like regulatory domain-containing protein [Asinibacterium sp. OR53]
MKPILTALLLVLSIAAIAQYSIHGKVVDDKTKKPLEGVSVFLANTTAGTVTNDKGEFQLKYTKPGKCELVVTSLNYENYVEWVQMNQTADPLIVNLKPTVNILKEVVVEPYDQNGWEKWGSSFESYFIGTPQLSKKCILKNPEVVKFRYNSNTNKLRAFSDDKLIFENKDLGYSIIYLLTRFEIDFNTNTFSYGGYPLFKELKPRNAREAVRWNQLRSNVYKGSLRNFVRSLYFNQLTKDGFEVREVKWISDGEKHRVKNVLKQVHDNEGIASSLKTNTDSMDYYVKVKRLADNENKLMLDHVVPRDSIIVTNTNDPNSKTLYFSDYLQVVFLNKRVPLGFAKTLPAYRSNEFIRSEINLRFNNPVFIYPNGNYYNGLDLIIEGYWVWSEKVSTMLPSDYTVSNL